MTVFLDTPVAAGTTNIPWTNAASDLGLVLLTQTETITQSGSNSVSTVFNVPAYSRLVDFIADTSVAWNSGTSNTLTVGITANSTSYANSVSVASTGRVRPTYTAGQLANMSNVSTNTTVVASVSALGAAATSGTTFFTMLYVMLPNPPTSDV